MFTYTAFENFNNLTHGSLEKVALAVKKRIKQSPSAQILVFSDSTGKQMDLDLSGTDRETLERLKIYSTSIPSSVSEGPGRPKLGVVSREVSLLPQHWEWLSNQSGGASSAIRTLVDEKLRSPPSEKEKVKKSQELTYRFLSAIAGDLPGFEEAIRFMYRRDRKKFKENISQWPKDLIAHTLKISETIFESEGK